MSSSTAVSMGSSVMPIGSLGHSFCFYDLAAIEGADEVRSRIGMILEIWEKIYSVIPDGICSGLYVATSLKKSYHTKTICTLEDQNRLIQAIASVELYSKSLRVQYLVVAPWNCFMTSSILNYNKIKTDEFYGIAELGKKFSVSIDQLLKPQKASGSLMMRSLIVFASSLSLESVELTALKDSASFYEKIGAKRIETRFESFLFELFKGIPEALVERTKDYF